MPINKKTGSLSNDKSNMELNTDLNDSDNPHEQSSAVKRKNIRIPEFK